jgi:hypothetical protein
MKTFLRYVNTISCVEFFLLKISFDICYHQTTPPLLLRVLYCTVLISDGIKHSERDINVEWKTFFAKNSNILVALEGEYEFLEWRHT